MARRLAKVLEEEIEEVFFYPSYLVNTKTTIPSGSVKSGGYISTTIHLPFGEFPEKSSNILIEITTSFICMTITVKHCKKRRKHDKYSNLVIMVQR